MGVAMDNEDVGENSKKGRNIDEDGNRPYKKAKYIWQLKGKYHLKQNNVHRVNDNATSKVDESSDSDSDSEVNCINNNANSVCNNKCCIDDIVAQSNAILDQFVSIHDLPDIAQSISEDTPVTLVKSSNKKQDEYLHKWQARQVAKSFVDNTINSILEHWKLAPFDATDFLENCENGEQVEDEGIMMAIQSHGLQSSMRDCPMNVDTGEASRYECHETQRTAIPDEAANKKLNSVDKLEDMDFLNAAVSVAIQKKGLSSYNYG